MSQFSEMSLQPSDSEAEDSTKENIALDEESKGLHLDISLAPKIEIPLDQG